MTGKFTISHLLHAFVVLILICVTTPLAQSAPPTLPKTAIQPLGKVKPAFIAQTKQSLERLYLVEVVILPAKELPADAYYRPRHRYRAEKLLDWLQANTDVQYDKIIGLTESDISTTKDETFFDWGILGLGELRARPCVISTFRLGRNVTRAKLLERLGKVACHEIGHTFGLDHCHVEGCLMRDAGGKVATVDGETDQLCDSCRQEVPVWLPRLPVENNAGRHEGSYLSFYFDAPTNFP